MGKHGCIVLTAAALHLVLGRRSRALDRRSSGDVPAHPHIGPGPGAGTGAGEPLAGGPLGPGGPSEVYKRKVC